MPNTHVPKSRSAHVTSIAPTDNPSPASVTPVNANAHARFGHSFGQIAVTSEDATPIQRQPEKNSCTVGEDDMTGLPTLPSLFPGMMSPDAGNASLISSQMAQSSQSEQAERQKIMADTQTKMFEIQQNITVNKARTSDKAFTQMDEYIRQ